MWVLGPIYRLVHAKNCDVVVEGASVELRMDMNRDDVALDVGVKFNVVVDIPLAKANSEIEAGVAEIGKIFIRRIIFRMFANIL